MGFVSVGSPVISRRELGNECVRASGGQHHASAEVDRSAEIATDENGAVSVGSHRTAYLVAGVAKPLAPYVLSVTAQLREESVRAPASPARGVRIARRCQRRPGTELD